MGMTIDILQIKMLVKMRLMIMDFEFKMKRTNA